MASSTVRYPEERSWPIDRRFRALSYRFRVRSDLPELGPVLDRLLGAFADPGHDGSARDGYVSASTYTLTHRVSPGSAGERRIRRYELFHDGRSVQRVANPGSMLEWVIIDSTRRAVRDEERFVAVHAGVVSLHGRAILLPAPPDSGKTTLAAALTRAGFAFLGDEVALLDPATGWVHPFPRPLLIEPPSLEILDGLASELSSDASSLRHLRYHVAADDLRIGSAGAPCPVGHVVVPAYDAGADTRLRPVSRATAILRLAEQTFNRTRMGKTGFRTLADVVRGAGCHELTVGHLGTAIGSLRALVDGSVARSAAGT